MTGSPRSSRSGSTGRTKQRPRLAVRVLRTVLIATVVLGIGYGVGLALGNQLL